MFGGELPATKPARLRTAGTTTRPAPRPAKPGLDEARERRLEQITRAAAYASGGVVSVPVRGRKVADWQEQHARDVLARLPGELLQEFLDMGGFVELIPGEAVGGHGDFQHARPELRAAWGCAQPSGRCVVCADSFYESEGHCARTLLHEVFHVLDSRHHWTDRAAWLDVFLSDQAGGYLSHNGQRDHLEHFCDAAAAFYCGPESRRKLSRAAREFIKREVGTPAWMEMREAAGLPID
jgi:hypothetical protein